MRWRAMRAAALGCGLAALGACAAGSTPDLGALWSAAGLGRSGALDEGTIVAGLREALEVGARRAVASASRPDGFLADPRIRIPLPEELEGLATGLRRIGFGAQVDRLELAMNRAAEQAAGEALGVFAGAIRQMSFSDARAILEGGDSAATQYLERTTGPELRRRFEPIVADHMQSVGLVRLYDDLVARWRALPGAPEPTLDLRSYVTERGLAGLFTLMAEEEQRIRSDPAARTSELLRRVFGARG